MYPYLMDSDHVSLIHRAGPEGVRIKVRYRRTALMVEDWNSE